jgi:hypothetical protein
MQAFLFYLYFSLECLRIAVGILNSNVSPDLKLPQDDHSWRATLEKLRRKSKTQLVKQECKTQLRF